MTLAETIRELRRLERTGALDSERWNTLKGFLVWLAVYVKKNSLSNQDLAALLRNRLSKSPSMPFVGTEKRFWKELDAV